LQEFQTVFGDLNSLDEDFLKYMQKVR